MNPATATSNSHFPCSTAGLLRIHTTVHRRSTSSFIPEPAMSLVAGPGRGGVLSTLPTDLQLYVQKHVDYIQSLDTVRRQSSPTTRASY